MFRLENQEAWRYLNSVLCLTLEFVVSRDIERLGVSFGRACLLHVYMMRLIGIGLRGCGVSYSV
jgi:hypothetical protein